MKKKTQKRTLILRLMLLIIGTGLLTNVIFMYRVANPTIGFTLQAALAVGIILYAFLFNQISRISKKIHIMIGTLCLIPFTFVLFLLIYGNVSNVEYDEDVVIVLGAGIHGETVSRPLAHRLNTAIAYWERNPNAYIVVTGGLGNRAMITEAEAMARYLIRGGVPPEQILLEELSTSTYENLKFAQEILDEQFPNGFRAVLITNDFHIYRAVRTARYLGIDVARKGAYTDWYTWPVNYLREMLAVIDLWFFPMGNYE